jgi:hypothetical protein
MAANLFYLFEFMDVSWLTWEDFRLESGFLIAERPATKFRFHGLRRL